MDELMSSLLVWQDGQLMSASSASSLHQHGQREDAEDAERVESAGSRMNNAPVGGTTADRISDMPPTSKSSSFRLRDTGKTELPPARDTLRSGHVSGAEKIVKIKGEVQDSTSLPCTAHASLQSKLSQGKSSTARRSSTATESQRMKAILEAQSAPPPSHQSIQPKMEIDMPDRTMVIPPMAPSGLMSIEDFELQHPYQPRLLKNGLPPRTVNPIKLENNDGSHSAALYSACQERGLIPRIDTPQVAQGCFKAMLMIDNLIVEQLAELYASKRDAKEELCRRALPVVYGLENKKKRKSTDSGDGCATVPRDLEEEEWMGILQHYVQSKKLQRPIVKTEGVHSVHGPFVSTLRLPSDCLAPFGSESGPFRTKKLAEKVAAREAVMWLRAQGKLDPNAYFHNPGRETKRRKSGDAAQPAAEGETSLTQLLQPGLDVNAPNQPLKEESPGKLVHTLTVALGFHTPTIYHEQMNAGAFVDTWAEFNPRDSRIEPRLAGQVGRVDRIFGKKVGKEMCMREVLKVLNEIRQSRIGDR